MVVDWAITEIVDDVLAGVPVGEISAKFHNMLAETAVAVAERVGEPTVALSGGCFQNKYLLERIVRRLREQGFAPNWHRLVPTNDGGIALGQTLAADRYMARGDAAGERRSEELCA
jgi:hydrogenase maturation protein HypF